MTKILVTGDRSWDGSVLPENVTLPQLLEVIQQIWFPGDETQPPTLIHGAAKGLDQAAEVAAQQLNWGTNPYPADWVTHGKRAGHIRNHEMIATNPNLVIAFPLESLNPNQKEQKHSRGTWNAVKQATKHQPDLDILIIWGNRIYPYTQHTLETTVSKLEQLKINPTLLLNNLTLDLTGEPNLTQKPYLNIQQVTTFLQSTIKPDILMNNRKNGVR